MNFQTKPPALTRAGGFTLIELMVAVAIVGILAAIAITIYSGYITRSKIQAAKGDLTALSLNLENELQRNLSYGAHITTSTDATVSAYPGWKPAQYNNFTYTMTSTASSYQLVATGSQGKVTGCKLTLNSTMYPAGSATSAANAQIGQVDNCGTVTAW